MTYHVVLFDDGLSLIPHNWLSDDKTLSFYPTNLSTKQFNIAVRETVKPDVHGKTIKWDISHFDVKRNFTSTDDIKKGENFVKLAETRSDLSSYTDDEDVLKSTRKERAKKEYLSTDDEIANQERETKSGVLPAMPDYPSFNNHIKSSSQLACNNTECDQSDRSEKQHHVQKEVPKIMGSFQNPILADQCNIFENFEINSANVEDNVCNDSSAIEKEATPHKTISSKLKVISNTKFSPHSTSMKPVSDSEKLNQLLRESNTIILALKDISNRLAIMEEKKLEYVEKIQPMSKRPRIHDPYKIPIRDTNSLEEFDAMLDNKEYFIENESSLSRFGGKDLEDVTKTILKKLLTDEVCEEYSLKGKKKRSFEDLTNVPNLIFCTVRNHCKIVTEAEVSKIVSSWLVNASKRLKSTENKKQKIKNRPLESGSDT